jgi:hypothetical protein
LPAENFCEGVSTMGDMISFVSIEKELNPQFREKINISENTVDVMNVFSWTAAEFLKRALGEKHNIRIADITLAPDCDPGYVLSERLLNVKELADVKDKSDLFDIINHFADSSKHRYIHLKKHPEKTNLKIK